MIIASTNQNMKAPEVRRALAPLMGLPSLEGGGGGGASGNLARANGKPVEEGAAKVISEFLDAINGGSKDKLAAFIRAHFAQGTGDASPEERAGRLGGLHENLGSLELMRMTWVDDAVQVVVKTQKEGEALLSVTMEKTAPWKILKLGVQVGG
jgi:hypothetical protein